MNKWVDFEILEYVQAPEQEHKLRYSVWRETSHTVDAFCICDPFIIQTLRPVLSSPTEVRGLLSVHGEPNNSSSP